VESVGVVNMCVMILYEISVFSTGHSLRSLSRTVWFSNEIQLGTMIDANVKTVART
jgi:hypothetical protein